MLPSNPKARRKLASDIAIYLREVGRKAQKGRDPNDRAYDRELERKLKRLPPLEIDALTRAMED